MTIETSLASSSLKGHLLLAMPQMSDQRFHHAVIFVCVHDDKGAMGITLNNPMPSPDFKNLLTQLNIMTEKPLDPSIGNMPVHAGGPVETVRGFLLHSTDFSQHDTIEIDEHFSISGTLDTLKALVNGERPEHMLFALGYAGWGKGQIEKELQENAWLTVPASYDLVFQTPAEEMWERAFGTIGVNPAMLSGIGGRA